MEPLASACLLCLHTVHPCCASMPRRELHEQCRQSLEEGYLHGLLLHALDSARGAAPAAAAGSDAAGVCLAALRLLSAIFGWSFSKGEGRPGWAPLAVPELVIQHTMSAEYAAM